MSQEKYQPSREEEQLAEESMNWAVKNATEAREKIMSELFRDKSPDEIERITRLIEGADIAFARGELKKDGFDSQISGVIRGHKVVFQKQGNRYLSSVDDRPLLEVHEESEKYYKTYEEIAEVLTFHADEYNAVLQTVKNYRASQEARKDLLLE